MHNKGKRKDFFSFLIFINNKPGVLLAIYIYSYKSTLLHNLRTYKPSSNPITTKTENGRTNNISQQRE